MKGAFIEIFLPSGDPRGIRRADLQLRSVRVFDVPRAEMAAFFALEDAGRVAVYYLFGETNPAAGARPPCYIGRTAAARERFPEHLKRKDYWTRALVAVSRTNTKTDTHAGYLEWRSIREAEAAGRYALRNGTVGTLPHMTDALKHECEELFDNTALLLDVLGYPLFTKPGPAAPIPTPTTKPAPTAAPLPSPTPPSPPTPDLAVTCTARGAHATGRFGPAGLTVLKGSRCAAGHSNPRHPAAATVATLAAMTRRRDALLASGVLALVDGHPVFQRDHLFDTPSGGSDVVAYMALNGWTAWKTADGRTLNDATGRAARRAAASTPRS